MKCAYAALALCLTCTDSKEASDVGMEGCSPAQGQAQRSALICTHPIPTNLFNSMQVRLSTSRGQKTCTDGQNIKKWCSCTVFERTICFDLQRNIYKEIV